MKPATLITINKIVDGERHVLMSSGNLKVMIAWAHTYGDFQLTSMLEEMKTFADEGRPHFPGTYLLNEGLELVLSNADAATNLQPTKENEDSAE